MVPGGLNNSEDVYFVPFVSLENKTLRENGKCSEKDLCFIMS